MSAEVTATGKITCFGNPVSFARVILYDDDGLGFDDIFGETTTNADGEFEVSGDATDGLFGGNPEPYIVVQYLFEGNFGRLRLVTAEIGGTTASDQTGTRGYDEEINFGTINFESLQCNAYFNVLEAMVEFNALTGLDMPYGNDGLLTVILNYPFSSRAFSNTDTIRVPPNYDNGLGLDRESALHEFAHTIRHSYDGGELHLSVDTLRYDYSQEHVCSSQTNEGFAFNEGWAEFWASSCLEFDGTNTDYTIEGNVAAALRKLQLDCDSTSFEMVDVLRASESGIHSFDEFNDQHDDLYGCHV